MNSHTFNHGISTNNNQTLTTTTTTTTMEPPTTTSQINNIPPISDNGVNHQSITRNSAITTSLPALLSGGQMMSTNGGVSANYNNKTTLHQSLNPSINSQKPWAPSATAPYPTLGGSAFAKQLASKGGSVLTTTNPPPTPAVATTSYLFAQQQQHQQQHQNAHQPSRFFGKYPHPQAQPSALTTNTLNLTTNPNKNVTMQYLNSQKPSSLGSNQLAMTSAVPPPGNDTTSPLNHQYSGGPTHHNSPALHHSPFAPQQHISLQQQQQQQQLSLQQQQQQQQLSLQHQHQHQQHHIATNQLAQQSVHDPQSSVETDLFIQQHKIAELRQKHHAQLYFLQQYSSLLSGPPHPLFWTHPDVLIHCIEHSADPVSQIGNVIDYQSLLSHHLRAQQTVLDLAIAQHNQIVQVSATNAAKQQSATAASTTNTTTTSAQQYNGDGYRNSSINGNNNDSITSTMNGKQHGAADDHFFSSTTSTNTNTPLNTSAVHKETDTYNTILSIDDIMNNHSSTTGTSTTTSTTTTTLQKRKPREPKELKEPKPSVSDTTAASTTRRPRGASTPVEVSRTETPREFGPQELDVLFTEALSGLNHRSEHKNRRRQLAAQMTTRFRLKTTETKICRWLLYLNAKVNAYLEDPTILLRKRPTKGTSSAESGMTFTQLVEQVAANRKAAGFVIPEHSIIAMRKHVIREDGEVGHDDDEDDEEQHQHHQHGEEDDDEVDDDEEEYEVGQQEQQQQEQQQQQQFEYHQQQLQQQQQQYQHPPQDDSTQ